MNARWCIGAVVQLLSCVQLFVTSWTVPLQAPLSSTVSQNLFKFTSIESVMPSSRHILSHPLLFLPSVFPSIRVLSHESALYIKWPKYWSFSFSSSPFNEYLGFISFRMDWFHLFAAQGTLKHRSLLVFLSWSSLLHGPRSTSSNCTLSQAPGGAGDNKAVLVQLFFIIMNIQSQYIPGWGGTSLSIITVLLRLCAVVTAVGPSPSLLFCSSKMELLLTTCWCYSNGLGPMEEPQMLEYLQAYAGKGKATVSILLNFSKRDNGKKKKKKRLPGTL